MVPTMVMGVTPRDGRRSMDKTKMLDMLTDACGTIDRICTVGLVIDCVQAREEAWRGDDQLARGLVAIGEMVREIRSDVQAVADYLCEERRSDPDRPGEGGR